MKPTKNNLNKINDSSLTQKFEGGGEKRKCNILKKLSHISEENIFCLKNMGEIEYVIKKINRLNYPIVLNPQESIFTDVGIWAYYNKRLSLSTIEKRLRYARFMENHKIPVDFKNPNYQNFRYHMDYREEIENATAHALKHEWKTMRMFLEAFGMQIWPYKPPIAPENKKRILPFPDKVREFFYYKYSKDEYECALYQYLFYLSFLVGWRIPSEICEMNLDDVEYNSKGLGTITITETKKRKSKRTIVPEKNILTSTSHKSLKNYIEVWRPKVKNQYSGESLFLWPNGKPVTVRSLGHKLSINGKKIWPHFKPYDMRHWCAVARLIETKIKTGRFEPYTVMNWLGHTKLKVTEGYIRHADMYYNQFNESWIHRALRSPRKMRGKDDGSKTRVFKKIKCVPEISPVDTNKPCRAHDLF